MSKLKVKITKTAVNLEMITANDLIQYSVIINRIQIKNRVCFVSSLKPVL